MTMDELKKFLPALPEYPDAPVTKWEIAIDVASAGLVAAMFAWFVWLG
jgi:hypothetical protein